MTHDRIHRQRLESLRNSLKTLGLDGFILPRMDAWPGEFVRACAERVAWLSGFTGSGGALVILENQATALTHSLYTLQIRRQVDPDLFEIGDIVKTPPAAWLATHAPRGAVIGYDPWLYTAPQIRLMTQTLEPCGIALRPVEPNPVDALWLDRPASPESVVEIFPDSLAGQTSAEKREKIGKTLQDQGAHAALIAAPDSIAWLLNIRGRDVPETPVALSFALLHNAGPVEWFINPARVGADVAAVLGPDVTLRSPGSLAAALGDLNGKTVLLDEARTPFWISDHLNRADANVKVMKDPCVLPKACKTPSEQSAMIEAHRRDGLAMIRLLAWIDREAPSGRLDEWSISERSIALRSEISGFRGVSFRPIVAFGPNAALPHYRVSVESSLSVQGNGILLIDSGGQYLAPDFAGTTDITRTIAIGAPSMEMKIRNTLVLKGHIAVATAVFPEGATGTQIDGLARAPLWAEGLDYLHGTGHGVGIYLGVHEDAASISTRENEAFRPGMIISNEPGYYREDAYGIRIENLVLVQDAGRAFEDGRRALGFKTITTVPIDRRLILSERLNAQERGWINAYHAEIFALYRDALGAEDLAWLKTVCAAV
ncbi:MAG: aminopeptidase P family protein [Rhodospirillales bacterium]|nr:aminopeptidase P family protein [Rhodospirillales bacterium]